MKTLFRAEVKNIGRLANCQVEPLTKVNEKFYAIGFESDLDGEYGITDLNGYYIECKRDTRSINFEDMLDKNCKKIFASLSEDGVGGDLVNNKQSEGGIMDPSEAESCIVKFRNGQVNPYFISSKYDNQKTYMISEHLEVTGIYKGEE